MMHTSINMRAFVTAASCRIVSTMRVLGSDEESDMDGESLLRVGDAEGEGVELEPPKPNIESDSGIDEICDHQVSMLLREV